MQTSEILTKMRVQMGADMLETDSILRQVDDFFRNNQGAEAEKLLLDSLKLAQDSGDDSGVLILLNELLGYYRETSRVEESYRLAELALEQMENMKIRDTVPYGTTLLNIANAYRAGGRIDEALKLYKETGRIYQEKLMENDMLMAGFYNNISLAYQEQENFVQAKECLLRALYIAEQNAGAEFETAVTYTNLAATCLKLDEDEEAAGNFTKAVAVFECLGVEDAHYGAALSALGTYFYKRKKYSEAAEYFRKAMEGMRRNFGENEYFERLKENLRICEQAKMVQESQSKKYAAVSEEANAGKGAETCEIADNGKNTIFNTGKAQNEDKEADEGVKVSKIIANSSYGTMQEHGQAEYQNGMELCRAYYEEWGKPMIHEKFPEYENRIAVGLVGEGSDCFGWDDEYSRDHDWGPGFCMWVSEDTYSDIGEALQTAYELLPREFGGVTRKETFRGTGRRGVSTISAFYLRLLGWDCRQSVNWLQMTDASLAAAVNGEVFRDEEGLFTQLRNRLMEGYPEQIRFHKLAQSAALFSQSGQYNYTRMLKRGDKVAAGIMLGDCMREAMKLCYYLDGKYPPHDKWLRRGLAEQPKWREICDILDLLAENDAAHKITAVSETSKSANRKRNPADTLKQSVEELIEKLAGLLAYKLYEEGWTSDTDPYLDFHTEELLAKASYCDRKDTELAEEIVRMEFGAFDLVENMGGRAFCQDDWETFSIMRKSQYQTWNRTMLCQYLYDFSRELSLGHNLIEEKYGRMMESTDPEGYEKIKEHFPFLNNEKKAIIETIVGLQTGWMEEFASRYPGLAGNARSIHTYEDSLYNTSYETYLRGEISTYSDKMLELYGRYVVEYAKAGQNLAFAIMENNVKLYGYNSLKEAEKALDRV